MCHLYPFHEFRARILWNWTALFVYDYTTERIFHIFLHAYEWKQRRHRVGTRLEGWFWRVFQSLLIQNHSPWWKIYRHFIELNCFTNIPFIWTSAFSNANDLWSIYLQLYFSIKILMLYISTIRFIFEHENFGFAIFYPITKIIFYNQLQPTGL